MDLTDLDTIIAGLRDEGSDTTSVEVKRAASGFPGDLERTLSAFANTPGGGVLILGLDEATGFAATGVYDAAACQSALAAVARQALDPPVMLSLDVLAFEGAQVVVAEVNEAHASAKPCRVRSSGRAYLRGYDGDYTLSDVEVQAFVANRTTPLFDQVVIEAATAKDLDTELVASYAETCRTTSATLGRFDLDELLFRTGVVSGPERRPTLAGLLALGRYPQQFAPNLVIQASVSPGPQDPPGTRAADARRFDGPLPVMLDEALRWVQRNTRTRVRFGRDGHGRDEPEYPAEAVRELIANALVHRDLGPHAFGYPITLTLEHNQLVITNPGGLWGITVDRLGATGVSSARNSYLLRIVQNVRSAGGRRVVEAIASGIPTVLRTLSEAGMVPPRFYDQGVQFVVRVPSHALLAEEDLNWLAEVTRGLTLNDTQRHALVAMRHGDRWTNRSLRDAFPMDSREAHTTLQGFVDTGLAIGIGERGGREYTLASATGRRGALDEGLFAGLLDDVQQPPRRRAPTREENAALLLQQFAEGPQSSADLGRRTGLSSRQVDYALRLLRERGTVLLDGARGVRTSTYRLSANARAERHTKEPTE